ncbi:MAG TPA: SBBP repeat-containing protein, partial [Candidatus Kapabacteria bacterium]|nr:SBBP repeat-containing protein [Candidatus Kapabacteria bacterium]
NNQPNSAVRYLFRSPGLNVQLRNNGFSYDSYKDEVVSHGKKESPLSMMHPAPQGKHKELSETKEITRHFHRVDIELVGAVSQPEITANSALTSTNNYYTHNQVIENVRSYETVMYKNVYPNIDLEFFISAEGKPEYQFYVRPGGDAKLIRLRYNGALNTRLAEGKIIMDVAHGSIAEHIPLSYLASSKQEVTVQYTQIGKNEFSCNVPSYPSTETIIIDPMPELSWGTYYGDSGWEQGMDIAVDGSGNVYVIGQTFSTNNIATTGAHQTTLGSSTDVFIAKFSPNGVLLWGTYYGGDSDDRAGEIAVDGSGNVYVIGQTFSTN